MRKASVDAAELRRFTGDLNMRFDVLQAIDDPSRFMLYEVYREKDNFAKHQQTEHYFRWRDAVTEWMAQPRQGAKFTPVFFGESEA